jgi:hypothetical protein
VDSISYKTKNLNKATAEKGWVLVDAENQALLVAVRKILY